MADGWRWPVDPIPGCSDDCGARYDPPGLRPVHSGGCPNVPGPDHTKACECWYPHGINGYHAHYCPNFDPTFEGRSVQ